FVSGNEETGRGGGTRGAGAGIGVCGAGAFGGRRPCSMSRNRAVPAGGCAGTPETPGTGTPRTSRIVGVTAASRCNADATEDRSRERVERRASRPFLPVRATSTLPGTVRGKQANPVAMRNVELARCFRNIAAYLEMEDVPFKPRAYEKAAQAIEAHDQPLDEVYDRGGVKALCLIPGIGRSMAEKLGELVTTGKCKLLEEYAERMPVDIAGLTALEGIGPKAVKILHERLGVRTVEDVAAAARAGKIRDLPHFGERSEQKILKALAFVQASGHRALLVAVEPLVNALARTLEHVPGVTRVAVAGSIRRRRETIGDADVLAVARKPQAVIAAFTTLPQVARVLGRGDTKASVKVADGLQIDLRVVPEESFGAALLYFTGSKAHNVALRQRAMKKKLKLNEYGLFRGSRRIAGRTEEEVYEQLGLAWIPPELREDQGEIEAAARGTLPELIEASDLRGDLQIQTDWTDGADSLEAMARAAKAAGLEYIAITDHTVSLAMTRGSDA